MSWWHILLDDGELGLPLLHRYISTDAGALDSGHDVSDGVWLVLLAVLAKLLEELGDALDFARGGGEGCNDCDDHVC